MEKRMVIVHEIDQQAFENEVNRLLDEGYKIGHLSTDITGGGDYVTTRHWTAIMVVSQFCAAVVIP